MSHITHETLHIDEVDHHSGLPMTTVSSTLAIIELKAYIKQVSEMNYVRTREVAVPYSEKA